MAAPNREPILQPRKTRQFSLRNFIICISVLGLVLGIIVHRRHARQELVQHLNDEKVYFQTSRELTHWFDRLPLIGAGDAIVAVGWDYDSKPNPETIQRLNSIGTVSELSFDSSVEIKDVELISRISTIKTIEATCYIRVGHVTPFRNHQLESFIVNGADLYPTHEAIKVLFSIPTLKVLGTAHGDFDVPEELRKQRPDITIEITDFPA